MTTLATQLKHALQHYNEEQVVKILEAVIPSFRGYLFSGRSDVPRLIVETAIGYHEVSFIGDKVKAVESGARWLRHNALSLIGDEVESMIQKLNTAQILAEV